MAAVVVDEVAGAVGLVNIGMEGVVEILDPVVASTLDQVADVAGMVDLGVVGVDHRLQENYQDIETVDRVEDHHAGAIESRSPGLRRRTGYVAREIDHQ